MKQQAIKYEVVVTTHGLYVDNHWFPSAVVRGTGREKRFQTTKPCVGINVDQHGGFSLKFVPDVDRIWCAPTTAQAAAIVEQCESQGIRVPRQFFGIAVGMCKVLYKQGITQFTITQIPQSIVAIANGEVVCDVAITFDREINDNVVKCPYCKFAIHWDVHDELPNDTDHRCADIKGQLFTWRDDAIQWCRKNVVAISNVDYIDNRPNGLALKYCAPIYVTEPIETRPFGNIIMASEMSDDALLRYAMSIVKPGAVSKWHYMPTVIHMDINGTHTWSASSEQDHSYLDKYNAFNAQTND